MAISQVAITLAGMGLSGLSVWILYLSYGLIRDVRPTEIIAGGGPPHSNVLQLLRQYRQTVHWFMALCFVLALTTAALTIATFVGPPDLRQPIALLQLAKSASERTTSDLGAVKSAASVMDHGHSTNDQGRYGNGKSEVDKILREAGQKVIEVQVGLASVIATLEQVTAKTEPAKPEF